MMRIRSIITTAAAFCACAAAACSSATEPELEFAFRIERSTGSIEEDAIPTSLDDGIRIDGHTWGSECGTYGAALQRTPDDGLVVVLTHYGSSLPCVAVAVPLEYTATIGDVAPGRYHLQVVHTADPPTEPRTVFHDFVTVN